MEPRLPTCETYKALIYPVPLRLSLENVPTLEASETCQFCSTLVPDRSKVADGSKVIHTSYERVDLYPEFPELKATAKQGCELCRLLRKTIRSSWATSPMEERGVGPLSETESFWAELFDSTWDHKVRIYDANFLVSKSAATLGNPSEGFGEMVVSLDMLFGPLTRATGRRDRPRRVHGNIGQSITFKVFDNRDFKSTAQAYPRQLPSPDTLCPDNLRMISGWINDCKSSHALCQVEEILWLPSRLLDVGALDGLQDPGLVETSSSNVQGTYAALSHMWGDMNHQPPLRTFLSNYEDMKAGIPMLSLPRNFAHAVTVARKLSLQYLWIDSLCIIQDSYQDWKTEAATMHKVYKYAYITIVATSALSTHDGFLDRQLARIPAAKIRYRLNTLTDDSSTMILAAQDDSESGRWGRDVHGSIWNTRGWTLQERNLSTRSIHFCKNKMYFHCRAGIRSEENEPINDLHPFPLWPRNEPWPKDSDKLNQKGSAAFHKKNKFYLLWTNTVADYTLRKLTQESDRLLAIQSTATEMASFINDTYISRAGMWRNNLQEDLLWRVRGQPTARLDAILAPSWSWVSVNGPVHWHFSPIRLNETPELLDDIPFRVPQYKDLGGGQDYLVVDAFLQHLAFASEAAGEEQSVYYSRTLPLDLYVSVQSPRRAQEIGTNNSLPSYSTIEARDAAIDSGKVAKFAEGHFDLAADNKDQMKASSRRLFYLHIASSKNPSGLILEKKTVHGPLYDHIYKRVGIASVFTSISVIECDLFYSLPFEEFKASDLARLNIT